MVIALALAAAAGPPAPWYAGIDSIVVDPADTSHLPSDFSEFDSRRVAVLLTKDAPELDVAVGFYASVPAARFDPAIP